MINEIDLSEGWRLMELKDICLKKAEYGSGAKAIDFEYKKPRYVRITDIDDNGNLKKNNIVSPDLVEEKYFLEENDLLFARSGSVGKTYLYKKSDGLCQFAGYLIRFKPNPAIIDSDYINYVVKSPHYWNWIESKKKTMTISNINAKQYSGLKIHVPPLKTQKKIVKIMEKAEKLKEWRAEADELADEYLNSVFLEMFGDPKNNPNGWKKVDFSEIMIGTPQNGLYKHSSYYTKDNSGVPILRIDSFYSGKIKNLNDLKRINCTSEEIKRFKLENDNIVINRVNSIEYLGKCALIENLSEPTVYESNMMQIKVDLNVINPVYLTKFLCTTFVYNQIVNKAKKAVNQASINQKDVNSLKILIPPITLQNQFAQIVQQVETLKTHQSKSKQEIDNLFNTLMQKAFKGELVC